jgi:hypothetical protein
VTDSEQKSEKVLEKLTKLISNMTQLEDMFSIETPTFILVHKKSNITTLPFNMKFKNNTIQLPDLFNLINNNNQINITEQITLKVYDKQNKLRSIGFFNLSKLDGIFEKCETKKS